MIESGPACARRLPWSFLRFAGVGGVCTLLQYLTLVVLVNVFALAAVIASTIGFIVSAMLNYYLNHVYTFRSDAPHQRALPRFGAIAGVGVLLNAAVVAVLHSRMSVHYLLAQVAATFVTLIWNFMAHRTWTFTRAKDTLEIPK
jgi:putative flippase GtrA